MDPLVHCPLRLTADHLTCTAQYHVHVRLRSNNVATVAATTTVTTSRPVSVGTSGPRPLHGPVVLCSLLHTSSVTLLPPFFKMLPYLCLVLAALLSLTTASKYVVSPDNLGLTFDGIGGLSGGGATSRLLPDYIEPYRSAVLDYLFLPSFGASLQLLKVEIGGDAQSTEGTEASHMHVASEESYERGYEWWLMKEAKARKPDIVLYGLSWGFPGWVAEGGSSPLTNSTVAYITKWLLAARDVHGLTIDYIGVWNENAYSREYILSLHASLRAHNLSTLIVAADDCCPPWDICDNLLKDSEWASVVARVGGSAISGSSSTRRTVPAALPAAAD